MKSMICVILLVLCLPLAASRFAVAQDNATEKPLSEQGYIGLALRDIPDGPARSTGRGSMRPMSISPGPM